MEGSRQHDVASYAPGGVAASQLFEPISEPIVIACMLAASRRPVVDVDEHGRALRKLVQEREVFFPGGEEIIGVDENRSEL